jgi:NAD(P)-dependent dehydrogenase (short-subunit alcohol dehydrogenase family)
VPRDSRGFQDIIWCMSTEWSPSGFLLTGRCAIVTGCARGLGRSLAHGLAAAGAQVLACDLIGDGAHAVATEIRAAGGKAHAFRMDVTDHQGALDAVTFGMKEFGSVDVLVNNAAIDIIEPVQEVSQENWNKILNVNLTGVFQCSQAAADQMIRQGRGGSIINVSSIASTAGIEKLAAYSAAKAGVNQLTRVMALELANHRIRVNAIAPGYLENVMEGASHEHSDLRKEQQILGSTPLGRRAQLSEIVGPVVFLASEAASYITGTVLFVDGGYTAR